MQATASRSGRMFCERGLGPRECRFFVCGNGITDHTFDRRCKSWKHVFTESGPGKPGKPGMLRTLRSIYRETGVAGLYAGLPVTMVIAVPANVLYFATYESMRDWILKQQPGNGPGQSMLWQSMPCKAHAFFSSSHSNLFQEFWLRWWLAASVVQWRSQLALPWRSSGPACRPLTQRASTRSCESTNAEGWEYY